MQCTVCTYHCMYVRTCVRVYIYISVCVSVWVCACFSAFEYIYICIYIYMCVCVLYICILYIYICILYIYILYIYYIYIYILYIYYIIYIYYTQTHFISISACVQIIPPGDWNGTHPLHQFSLHLARWTTYDPVVVHLTSPGCAELPGLVAKNGLLWLIVLG